MMEVDVEPQPVEAPQEVNAAAEAEQRIREQVVQNVVVMNGVFKHLGAQDLLASRAVCTLWNDLLLSLFSQHLQVSLQLASYGESNCAVIGKAASFSEFLSQLTPFQLEKCVFRHAEFSFGGLRSQSLGDPTCFETMRVHGWLLHHVLLRTESVRDIYRITRHCPNVKTLAVSVQPLFNLEREPETGRLRLVVVAWDETDYSDEDAEGIVVLTKLERIIMSYHVQWYFGQFWASRAPNLVSVKFVDFCGRGRYVTGRPADEELLANQVALLKTSQIKDLQLVYACEVEDPNVYAKTRLTPLLESDLTSLNSFQITLTSNVVLEDLGPFLQKVAGTLTCLDLSDRSLQYNNSWDWDPKDLDSFPVLTKVRKCEVPHRLINRADFFDWFPSLVILKIEGYTRRLSYAEGRTYGFHKDNMKMWRIGGGWCPHNNLKVFHIDLIRHVNLPPTLVSLFPQLSTLVVCVFPTGLKLLLKAMTMFRNQATLHTLKVRVATNAHCTRNHSALIALVLAGVEVQEVAKRDRKNRGMGKLHLVRAARDFSNKISLRNMTHLRNFYFEDVLAQAVGKIKPVLKEYCFDRMPNLQRWYFTTMSPEIALLTYMIPDYESQPSSPEHSDSSGYNDDGSDHDSEESDTEESDTEGDETDDSDTDDSDNVQVHDYEVDNVDEGNNNVQVQDDEDENADEGNNNLQVHDDEGESVDVENVEENGDEKVYGNIERGKVKGGVGNVEINNHENNDDCSDIANNEGNKEEDENVDVENIEDDNNDESCTDIADNRGKIEERNKQEDETLDIENVEGGSEGGNDGECTDNDDDEEGEKDENDSDVGSDAESDKDEVNNDQKGRDQDSGETGIHDDEDDDANNEYDSMRDPFQVEKVTPHPENLPGSAMDPDDGKNEIIDVETV